MRKTGKKRQLRVVQRVFINGLLEASVISDAVALPDQGQNHDDQPDTDDHHTLPCVAQFAFFAKRNGPAGFREKCE